MSPDKRTEAMESVALIGKLTERESEIAGLLLKGRTYRMIAGELFLSENTIKTHIKSLYSKLNIKSKGELISLMLGKDPTE
jgi:DNA-binding NarL/FixJ family response regulator